MNIEPHWTVLPRLLASGFVALATVGACGSEPTPSESEDPSHPKCSPGEGASGSPQSVSDIVQLVNSLPKPTTLECFLESLDRPLRAEAAVSSISAQLSVGARSPRFFLFSGPLIMTLAPEGDGSRLLELGELVTETRSLKAEIEFPVEGELSEEAPYEKALFDDGSLTGCAFCHADEVEVEGAPGRFVSVALRPGERSLVPLEDLEREREICDRDAEPERCAFFEALFGGGEIEHQPFPDEFESFGN